MVSLLSSVNALPRPSFFSVRRLYIKVVVIVRVTRSYRAGVRVEWCKRAVEVGKLVSASWVRRDQIFYPHHRVRSGSAEFPEVWVHTFTFDYAAPVHYDAAHHPRQTTRLDPVASHVE